jgi:hypothetical protein
VRAIGLALGLVLLVGCASVTRPFTSLKPDYSDVPAEDLGAVAQEIEAAIQAGERNPEIADRNGIVVNDPQILQAIRTRAARNELLNEFRNSGFAVEQRNGLIEIRNGGGYAQAFSSKQRDRNALLIYRENADRWTLYEGIMNKSNFPPRALSAIQRTFFEARVQVLPDGQKYEDDNGVDVAKGAAQ